jgi:hypothetical protein
MVRSRAQIHPVPPSADRPRSISAASPLGLRKLDFCLATVDPIDELQDIRACLSELIEVQRRIADEIQRRSDRSSSPGPFQTLLGSLVRSTSALREAVNDAPVAGPETLCWRCNQPIVKGRAADPPDVRRHMVECAPGVD